MGCTESCYQEYIKLVLTERSKSVENFVSDKMTTTEKLDVKATEPLEKDISEE